MANGVDAGGPGGSGVEIDGLENDDEGSPGGRHPRGILPRQSSAASLNLSGVSERYRVDVSRVNALKASIDRHSDAIYKLLLGSKEHLDKRMQIESAFRVCRDAFIEVSSVLTNLLEEQSTVVTAGDMRKVVAEALEDLKNCKTGEGGDDGGTDVMVSRRGKSYASVVSAALPKVHVAGGPTVGVTNTTNFLVVPDQKSKDVFRSSQETREALFRVLKPSECGLKVNRVSSARNNGVRIQAFSPDLASIKAHPGLAKIGLKVQESVKLNPRLIVHGVPIEMTAGEIEKEFVAQNLSKTMDGAEIKVIYIFPSKQNKRVTSCVLEVTSSIRKALLSCGRIFLRYSSCSFSDYVRVIQWYRCLAFGHMCWKA